MKTIPKHFLSLSALATAALTAGSVLAADSEDAATLALPSSEVSVGLGVVSRDNQRFGQYNGLYDNGGYGLLDADIVKRDDATGTWLKMRARNLGLDNRELRFEHNRQGNWGYFLEYSQTPRYDPFTVTTQLSGIGTTTQTLIGNPVPSQYHLKTERDAWTLGFEKSLSPGLGFRVRFKNEEKDGERLWGQGTFSTWRFLTDPINQTTRQFDATLDYTTERLQLSGGYYGTRFENKNNALTVLGASVVFDTMALPPDNSSHQFHLAGGYNFTKTTRGTFKVAYGRITQEDTFPTVAAIARSNLGGQIDTTLIQFGLTAKPVPKLTLRADLNYQNREDKTPVLVYWPSQAPPLSTTGTNNGTNEPRDIRTLTGKIEAGYRLPMGLGLKGGVEFQEKTRNSPPVRSVDFRETTDETTYKIELRRSMSETVTGAVSLLHSKRDGSDWLPMVNNTGAPTSALIAPLHLIDRKRNTVRLTVNWMPVDPLSLSFRADESRDNYSGRGLGGFDLGPRKGRGSNYSVDAAYAFTQRISGTAWYSRNENRYEHALCRDDVANVCNAIDLQPVWGADLRNISNSYGLGLSGKATSNLEFGADLAISRVRDELNLSAISPAVSSVVTPLPNINTRVTTLRIYGKYARDRHSGFRVDYIFDHYRTDDWTWANWTYTAAVDGGTTVFQNPNQTVSFFGVSYYYRWH